MENTYVQKLLFLELFISLGFRQLQNRTTTLPAHDTNPGFHESILGERRVDHLAQQLLAGTVVRSTDGTTILQDAETVVR